MPESRRVLLLEDNPMLAQMLRAMLEASGHRVTHASTVRTAMRWLEGHTADLLILDDELPDGSGVDVARVARLHDRRRRAQRGEDTATDASDAGGVTPIVAMLSSQTVNALAPWQNALRVMLVGKPLEMSQLSAAVRQGLAPLGLNPGGLKGAPRPFTTAREPRSDGVQSHAVHSNGAGRTNGYQNGSQNGFHRDSAINGVAGRAASMNGHGSQHAPNGAESNGSNSSFEPWADDDEASWLVADQEPAVRDDRDDLTANRQGRAA
jgi:CheY-like chemotaxis protein